jgi:DNA-binding transcriptional LysR family regulator
VRRLTERFNSKTDVFISKSRLNWRMLDGRSVSFFVALADELHFGRTAARLDVSQAVLSVHIKRLEDQVGAALLHRGKRAAVRLTRAGEIFLPEARAALARLEQAERIARLASRGECGPLRIGYVFSAAICGLVPRILRILRERSPLLEVSLRLMETPSQLAALANGHIDLAVVRPRPVYPADVATCPVHREGALLALSPQHPLAGRKAIVPADLSGETFIIPQFHEQVGLIDLLSNLAAAGGFQLQTLHRTPDFIATLSMVAGGYGVALVPRSLERLALAGVVYRPIDTFREILELTAAYRSDLASPSTLELARTLTIPARAQSAPTE